MATHLAEGLVPPDPLPPLLPPQTMPRAPGPLLVDRPLKPVRVTARPKLLKHNRSVLAMSAMDVKGRISAPALVRTLGWTSDTALHSELLNGAVLVRQNDLSAQRLIGHGQLRLPAAARRACGIRSGDRVLICADTDATLLIVYPPALLESLVHKLNKEILDEHVDHRS